jgi:two-component system, NtrC family, sensor histidine kinase HydH
MATNTPAGVLSAPMDYASLDAAPIATAVVRAGRFVYANHALLVIGRWRREDLVGRPFTDLLPPEEAARVADRYARRMRGEPVPQEYEVMAIGADGAPHAIEVFITRDGDDSIMQITDAAARVARRERRTRLAEVGVAVHSEHDDQGILRVLS